MQLILDGKRIPVDVMELNTVKSIVSEYFSMVSNKAKEIGSPTFYWTFLIWIHMYSGILLDNLDVDAFEKGMEAIEKNRRRFKAEKRTRR